MITERSYTAHRQALDLADYPASAPVSTDGLDELPLGSVVRGADGRVVLAYLQLWPDGHPEADRLREALLRADYATRLRFNGVPVTTVPFGWMGRGMPLRDWCTPGKLDRDHPGTAQLLHPVAWQLEAIYRQLSPVTFAHHVAQAGRVDPQFRLPGCLCFTGGVVNLNSAIGWHHDAGNYQRTWSAMPILRADMAGGALVIPELGIWLAAADRSVVFFDGQSLLHGVTPMAKTSRAGHRLTVVFYSMVKLWQCLPPADELARAQERRTERELRRARGGPARVSRKDQLRQHYRQRR